MSRDTEAMTRTTDIAHFYKVTTAPDPEWGSGSSVCTATEISSHSQCNGMY